LPYGDQRRKFAKARASTAIFKEFLIDNSFSRRHSLTRMMTLGIKVIFQGLNEQVASPLVRCSI